MAEIGTAYVSLLPSAKGFGSAVEKEMGGAGTKAGATASKGFSGTFTKGLGALAYSFGALFAVDKVKDFFASSIAEARDSQKVAADTANVIKTTGGAANVSAKQIGTLATAISNKTGIDDEAIQSASNMLLTFTNLRNEVGKGNDVFSQATQIATDMGAKMHKGPEAASIMLGKALNDPTKGLTALTRVGVVFDAQQTKTIKKLQASGNTLGAQKVILKELRKEYGGTAAASSTAGEKASVAFGNLKEQIGTALLPVIDKIEGVLTNKVIPAVSTFITQMQTGKGAGGQFADAVHAVYDGFKVLWPILESVGKFLADHIEIVYGIAAAFVVWELATLAFNVVQAVQLALLMVATPGTFLYAVATGVAAAATAVWAAAVWLLTTPLGLLVLAIVAVIVVVILIIKYHKQIGAFIGKVWGKVKDAVVKATSAAVGWVKQRWSDVIGFLRGIPGKIAAALRGMWRGIQRAWTVVYGWLRGRIAAFLTFVRSLPGKIASGLRSMWQGAKDAWLAFGAWEREQILRLVAFIGTLPGRIASLAGRLLAAGKSLGSALMNGIMAGLRAVGGMVGNLVTAIKNAINSALHLPFTIKGPGPLPDFTVPRFATGGRAKGSVVQVGDGQEWESIVPDSLMVKALASAARAGNLAATGDRAPAQVAMPDRLRLVVDGYEFNAYVDNRADERVASATDLSEQRGRAAWR